MDGENNGSKPYENGWFGGTLFLETPKSSKTQVTFATGDGDLRSPRRDLRRRREEPWGTGTAERRQLLWVGFRPVVKKGALKENMDENKKERYGTYMYWML